jgi:hypothetical protein
MTCASVAAKKSFDTPPGFTPGGLMPHRRSLAVLLALTLISGTALATAPQMNRWRSTAKAHFQTLWQQLKSEMGFGYAADMVAGSLPADDDEYFPFDFVGHRDYVIAGVCDGDCRDLDLVLYDENDNVIAADRDPDAEPVLTLRAGLNGRYYVEAVMVSCSVEPCFYAVQVFHRYAGDQP